MYFSIDFNFFFFSLSFFPLMIFGFLLLVVSFRVFWMWWREYRLCWHFMLTQKTLHLLSICSIGRHFFFFFSSLYFLIVLLEWHRPRYVCILEREAHKKRRLIHNLLSHFLIQFIDKINQWTAIGTIIILINYMIYVHITHTHAIMVPFAY